MADFVSRERHDRTSLGSAREEHPCAGKSRGDTQAERAGDDQDQSDSKIPDRRRLGEEAAHKPAPPEQQGRRGQQQPPHFGKSSLNCSSSRIATFNFWAFSSFEPAPGPATTKSVLELTLPAALPPSLRTRASASGRLIVSNVPVKTKVLPVNGPSPTASAASGSTPAATSLSRSAAPGPRKYAWTSWAMLGPTPSTARSSSSEAPRNRWIEP